MALLNPPLTILLTLGVIGGIYYSGGIQGLNNAMARRDGNLHAGVDGLRFRRSPPAVDSSTQVESIERKERPMNSVEAKEPISQIKTEEPIMMEKPAEPVDSGSFIIPLPFGSIDLNNGTDPNKPRIGINSGFLIGAPGNKHGFGSSLGIGRL